MPEAVVRLRYDGSDVDGGLDRLKSKAFDVKGAIGLMFGAITAERIIAGAKDTYMELARDEAAADKLANSFKRLGASADLYASAMTSARNAARNLGREDDAVTAAIESMAVRMNDAKAAVADTNLMLNTAAKFNLDLGTAADVVSAAATGQMKKLGQLLPFLKEYITNVKSADGTAQAAAEAIRILNEATAGASTERMKTGLGQMERAKTLWGEVKKDMLMMVTHSNSIFETWKKISDLLSTIHSGAEKLFDTERTRVGKEAMDKVPRNFWSADITMAPYRARVKAYQDAVAKYDLDKQWAEADAVAPRASSSGGVPEVPDAPWKRRFAPSDYKWQGPLRPEHYMQAWQEQMNAPYGRAEGSDRFADRMGLQGGEKMKSAVDDITEYRKRKEAELEAVQRQAQDKRAAEMQHTAQLMQGGFEIAFTGMLTNFKGTVDQMRDYLIQQLIREGAMRLAGLLTGALFGGLGAAAGSMGTAGGAGGFIDSGGGGIGAMGAKGYGVGEAGRSNAYRRAARW